MLSLTRQEVPTMNVRGMGLGGMVLAAVVAGGLGAGCASAGGEMRQRGTVLLTSASARAIVAGPAVVHAFSMDHGGRVYAATAQAGSDADCAVAADVRQGPNADLVADSVKVVSLAPGQVACIQVDGRRSYELLWHARPMTPTETAVAVAYGAEVREAKAR
jgi:hypothetical protein